MPATCEESDSWTCAAVYDWTGNETLAHGATWVIGKPLAILVIVIGAVVVRWLASKAIDRVVRRAETAPLPGRQEHLQPPGPAGEQPRHPAQEHHHHGGVRGRLRDGALRGRDERRPDPGQRRRAGPGHRLRRPEPRQGLPVRRDDDDRGPVRRRRRRRPRRGHRHRRERRAAGHPRPRRRRHRLVRPQRRDPASRQPEPELGPHRARHLGELRRGPQSGHARCSPRSRTACGRTRTTRTSSSRSPRSGACRTSAPTASSSG